MKGSDEAGNSRVLIRVGDVEIDISGSQREVDAEMMNIRDGRKCNGFNCTCVLWRAEGRQIDFPCSYMD